MLSCEAQGRSRNGDANDETALGILVPLPLVCVWKRNACYKIGDMVYSCITKIVEQSIVSVMSMIE